MNPIPRLTRWAMNADDTAVVADKVIFYVCCALLVCVLLGWIG